MKGSGHFRVIPLSFMRLQQAFLMQKSKSFLAIVLAATLTGQPLFSALASPVLSRQPLGPEPFLTTQALTTRLIFQRGQSLRDRFVASRVIRLRLGIEAANREDLLPLDQRFVGWHQPVGFERYQLFFAQGLAYVSATLAILQATPILSAVVSAHLLYNVGAAIFGGRMAVLPNDWFKNYDRASEAVQGGPVRVRLTPKSGGSTQDGVVESVDRSNQRVKIRFPVAEGEDENVRTFNLTVAADMLEILDLPPMPPDRVEEIDIEEIIEGHLRGFHFLLSRGLRMIMEALESNPDLHSQKMVVKHRAVTLTAEAQGRVFGLPKDRWVGAAERLYAIANASQNGLIFFLFAPRYLFSLIAIDKDGEFLLTRSQFAGISRNINRRVAKLSPGAILHSLRGPHANLPFTFIVLSQILRWGPLSFVRQQDRYSRDTVEALQDRGVDLDALSDIPTTYTLHEKEETMLTVIELAPRDVEEFSHKVTPRDTTSPVSVTESAEGVQFWTRPAWVAHPFIFTYRQTIKDQLFAQYRTALVENDSKEAFLYIFRADFSPVKRVQENYAQHRAAILADAFNAFDRLAQHAGLSGVLIAPDMGHDWVNEEVKALPVAGIMPSLHLVDGMENLSDMARDISGDRDIRGPSELAGLDGLHQTLHQITADISARSNALEWLNSIWPDDNAWKQMVLNRFDRLPAFQQNPFRMEQVRNQIQNYWFLATLQLVLGRLWNFHMDRARLPEGSTLTLEQRFWIGREWKAKLQAVYSPVGMQQVRELKIDWSKAPQAASIAWEDKVAVERYLDEIHERIALVHQWSMGSSNVDELMRALPTHFWVQKIDLHAKLRDVARSVKYEYDVTLQAPNDDVQYYGSYLGFIGLLQTHLSVGQVVLTALAILAGSPIARQLVKRFAWRTKSMLAQRALHQAA